MEEFKYRASGWCLYAITSDRRWTRLRTCRLRSHGQRRHDRRSDRTNPGRATDLCFDCRGAKPSKLGATEVECERGSRRTKHSWRCCCVSSDRLWPTEQSSPASKKSVERPEKRLWLAPVVVVLRNNAHLAKVSLKLKLTSTATARARRWLTARDTNNWGWNLMQVRLPI